MGAWPNGQDVVFKVLLLSWAAADLDAVTHWMPEVGLPISALMQGLDQRYPSIDNGLAIHEKRSAVYKAQHRPVDTCRVCWPSMQCLVVENNHSTQCGACGQSAFRARPASIKSELLAWADLGGPHICMTKLISGHTNNAHPRMHTVTFTEWHYMRGGTV